MFHGFRMNSFDFEKGFQNYFFIFAEKKLCPKAIEMIGKG